ncbi:MAG: hypothetical protein WD898_04095 [Candidatus Paceibacterota bacterium]
MSEIFKQDPDLANSIVESFLKSFNEINSKNFKFAEWDEKNNSPWDFKAIDESEEELEVQIIEASPTHDPEKLKEFRKFFEKDQMDSMSSGAIEPDDIRLEAAVGRKCIEQKTAKLIPKKDIVLLVIFRYLPYESSNLEQMSKRLKDMKIENCFRSLWVISENGQCDMLE